MFFTFTGCLCCVVAEIARAGILLFINGQAIGIKNPEDQRSSTLGVWGRCAKDQGWEPLVEREAIFVTSENAFNFSSGSRGSGSVSV